MIGRRLEIWRLVAVVAVFLCGATVSFAQDSSFSYSGGSSFAFGNNNGYVGGFQDGGTATLLDAGFSGGGGGDFLGCAGVDIFSYLENYFNVGDIVEEFTAYAKTMVAKWLLTQLFTSPMLSSVFDTLQAFGNVRVEMMRASCDIGEIREDAKQIMVDNCVKKNKDRADAETYCSELSNENAAKDLIKEANLFLENAFKNSILGDVIDADTNFCGDPATRNTTGCALLAFVPQIRICAYGGMGGGGAGGCTETGGGANAQEALLRMSKILDIGHLVFGDRVYRPYGGAVEDLLEAGGTLEMGFATARTLPDYMAGMNTGDTPGGIGMVQLDTENPVQVAKFFDYKPKIASFAGEAEIKELDQQFKDFLNCSITDATLPLKAFKEKLAKDWNIRLPEDITDPYGERIDTEQLLDADKLKPLGIDIAIANETIGEIAENLTTLLNTGINCIANHHVHVSIETALSLRKLEPAMEEAYYSAAANRASYLLVELLLRFTMQKLLAAKATLAANSTPPVYYQNGECGQEGGQLSARERSVAKVKGNLPAPCGDESYPYPVGMIEALQSVIDMFENQIHAINAITKERDKFAEMSAQIEQRLQAN